MITEEIRQDINVNIATQDKLNNKTFKDLWAVTVSNRRHSRCKRRS